MWVSRACVWIAGIMVVAVAAPAGAVDKDLRKLARSKDSGDRVDAVWLLAKSPDDTEAHALFADLLVDEDPLVRDNAVIAAGRFTTEEAIARMARKAATRDAIDRSNVAMALAMTKSPAALPTLEQIALSDRDATVRRDAVWELSRFADSNAAFEIAERALSDDDPRVRVAALRTASFTNLERARPAVLAALEDDDDRARAIALQILCKYGADTTAPHMQRLARDPSHRVRLAAATAAWALRTREAIDALVPLVADERDCVAALAHRTLRLLTRKPLDRDPQLWSTWWEKARETWRLPRNIESKWFWDDKYASPAEVDGARQTSDALVIVLDVSSALLRPASDGGTRWDAIRREVTTAIEALPDGTLLNVVTAGEKVETAFAEPRALDDRTRTRIARVLEDVRPDGGCDLWGGLEAALAQPGIDTVLVVGSEKRNRGAFRHKTSVWSRARREYLTNAVIVHSVRIPTDKSDEADLFFHFAEDTLGRALKKEP